MMLTRERLLCGLLLPMACFLVLPVIVSMAGQLPVSKNPEQQALDEMAAQEETPQRREAETVVAPADLISRLPEDNTVEFMIRQLHLEGNTLLSNTELLRSLPPVYNASAAKEIESVFLYDFRPIQKLIEQPGTTQPISARTIQGLTQYLLSRYQRRGFAGIYVYVPTDAFEPGKALASGILPIRILETKVIETNASYFDVTNQPSEKSYLREEVLLGWSPVQAGQTANRKKLDRYIKQMNLNPDRYISALVSQGAEPNSLSLSYNVYEANPWHFFIQVDNSGTDNLKWKPRAGLINTNLLGFDDRLTTIYQTSPDSHWDEEYAVYGSYDFPLAGPGLRLTLFAGYNEFDSIESGGISFLGRGSFYGGTARYNLLQSGDWFLDLTGTISHEESRVTPSLFPEFLSTNLHWTLGGYGAELYLREDRRNFLFGFTRYEALDGSVQSEFGLARTGAERDFSLLDIYSRHSQYLDENKVHRLSGTLKWLVADDRLPPGRMTSFGGMYTVRGYDEYEIIADSGVLTSLQYEYDLVRKEQTEAYAGRKPDPADPKPFLRKLAPLLFVDYGLAQVEDPLPAEHRDQELLSIGTGLILELGDHFTGTVYHGYPLIATDDTRQGKGRLHAGFLIRW